MSITALFFSASSLSIQRFKRGSSKPVGIRKMRDKDKDKDKVEGRKSGMLVRTVAGDIRTRNLT